VTPPLPLPPTYDLFIGSSARPVHWQLRKPNSPGPVRGAGLAASIDDFRRPSKIHRTGPLTQRHTASASRPLAIGAFPNDYIQQIELVLSGWRQGPTITPSMGNRPPRRQSSHLYQRKSPQDSSRTYREYLGGSPVGPRAISALTSRPNFEVFRERKGPHLRAFFDIWNWRTTADEDGHYCFAVAL
jgi:hypothetical protein